MGNILFLPFPSPSNAIFGAGYIFIRLLPKMILFTEPAEKVKVSAVYWVDKKEKNWALCVFQAKKSCAKSSFEPRLCLLLVLRYSSLKTFYNLVIWSSRWLQTNIGKDCLLSCLSATFCPKIGKNSFCRQKVFFVGILETLSFCARKYGGWTSGRSVVKVVRCLSPLPPSNASLSSAVSEIWPKKRSYLPGKI